MSPINLSRVIVVICTHNPDRTKLLKVIELVLANSNVVFRIILVENKSSNLQYLSDLKNFPIEIVREDKIGNSYARFTGMQKQSENELLVFVDDDNYISPNYLEKALDFANTFPDIGAFGGNTTAVSTLNIPTWKSPFLPYLGVRSMQEELIIKNASLNWNEAQPIGAGMCIRPEVTHYFLQKAALENYFSLGRVGKRTCSGEDAFIANQCHHLNLKWGLTNSLTLIHDIKLERLNVKYLVRLLYNYGYSDVILDRANETEPAYPYPRNAKEALLRYLYFARKGRSGLILGLRQFGLYVAFRKFNRVH